MEDTLNNGNIPVVPTADDTALDPTAHVPVEDSPLSSPDSNPEDLDSRWLRWKCLNCGYLYEGSNKVRKCPRCGNENPDLFEDAD